MHTLDIKHYINLFRYQDKHILTVTAQQPANHLLQITIHFYQEQTEVNRLHAE